MVRVGMTLIVTSGIYLLGGLSGLLPLELEVVTWNNIRIVSGAMILGCLITAVGYGNG